jgi:hypothetical protein
MRHLYIILFPATRRVFRLVEVGETMSHDKLDLTARAAGFAMACDETAGGPIARQGPLQATYTPHQRQESHPVRSTATALVPIKSVRPSMSFGLMGWSFWKTA